MKKPIEPAHRIFGGVIEQIRTTLGWKQADLAKKVGQTRPAIANIEGGKQRLLLHHIDVFAEAFGMSSKELAKRIWQ